MPPQQTLELMRVEELDRALAAASRAVGRRRHVVDAHGELLLLVHAVVQFGEETREEVGVRRFAVGGRRQRLAVEGEGQAGECVGELFAAEELELVAGDFVQVDDVRGAAVGEGAERGEVDRVVAEFGVQVGQGEVTDAQEAD